MSRVSDRTGGRASQARAVGAGQPRKACRALTGFAWWVVAALATLACGPALSDADDPSGIPAGVRSAKCQAACADQGQCFDLEGRCVAQEVADCRVSAVCKARGTCSLGTEGQCAALNQADCEASTECAERGSCELDVDIGVCKASMASCGRHPVCREKGWCALNRGAEEGAHYCYVGSDEDCSKSALCTADGLCHASEGNCVARSDEDCGKATVCKTLGRCQAIWGVCQQPCAKQPDCAKRGLCVRSEEGGVCWATVKVHCLASTDCKERGWCSLDHNRCIVRSHLDCFRATVCRKEGACRHWDGDAPGCYHPNQFKCNCPPKGTEGPAEPCAPGSGWGPMCGTPE